MWCVVVLCFKHKYALLQNASQSTSFVQGIHVRKPLQDICNASYDTEATTALYSIIVYSKTVQLFAKQCSEFSPIYHRCTILGLTDHSAWQWFWGKRKMEALANSQHQSYRRLRIQRRAPTALELEKYEPAYFLSYPSKYSSPHPWFCIFRIMCGNNHI